MVSASPAPPQAASTMARSRRRRGAKIPGVSMNTSWLAPSTAMPRTGIRVVCTLRLTMLTLAPTRVLTSVDLPAFGAPMTAMKPQRVSGAGAWSLIGGPSHALAREQSGGGGLLYGGNATLLWHQFLGVLFTIVWCGVVTAIIALLIKYTIGFRVTEEAEAVGIDEAEHKETAYEFASFGGGGAGQGIGAPKPPVTTAATVLEESKR